MTLSPTAIQAYLDCPMYFKRKYVDKWEVPDTPPTVIGTFLHGAVAQWFETTAEPLWGDLEFQLFEVGGGELDTAKSFWRTWVTHSQFRNPDGVEIEIKTHDRKLGDVHCFLDYVQVPLLVDHKFVGKQRKKDPMQLAFYRRFAPCTTKWCYEIVTPDTYEIQWVNEDELLQADLVIDRTADLICLGAFSAMPRPMGRGTYFDWCPFQAACGECTGS